MSHYRAKYKATSSSFFRRLVVLLAAACVVGMLGTGCERDITVSGNDGESNNTNNNDENNQENNGEDHPYDDDYFEEHGPDEDEELTEAGALQGSWRVAAVEGDVPVVYFDVFHDAGEPSASGHFTHGIAVAEFYDGNTGEIEAVNISDDGVEVQWNPTDQDTEMYTVTLTAEGDDTYQGDFSAEQNPETLEVVMTQTVDDE